VLLDVNHTARLADFGYSSLVGNIPEALAYLQRSTARPGALRWIAPEQVDPEETFNRTTKTDIYSFGCVALQGSWLDSDAWPMLISLQVLSGKQPWSEVREDSAVVLRLAKGHKPGRPESRTLDDSHWNLIQHCWSPMDERPAAEVMIPTIRQFLDHCPQPPPLCDLLRSWSGQADLGAESLSPSQAPTEGSGTHVTHSDEEDYLTPVDYIDTSASTPISSASLSDITSLHRRTSLTGMKSVTLHPEVYLESTEENEGMFSKFFEDHAPMFSLSLL
jgi:serine/threonine protein kinase